MGLWNRLRVSLSMLLNGRTAASKPSSIVLSVMAMRSNTALSDCQRGAGGRLRQ